MDLTQTAWILVITDWSKLKVVSDWIQFEMKPSKMVENIIEKGEIACHVTAIIVYGDECPYADPQARSMTCIKDLPGVSYRPVDNRQHHPTDNQGTANRRRKKRRVYNETEMTSSAEMPLPSTPDMTYEFFNYFCSKYGVEMVHCAKDLIEKCSDHPAMREALFNPIQALEAQAVCDAYVTSNFNTTLHCVNKLMSSEKVIGCVITEHFNNRENRDITAPQDNMCRCQCKICVNMPTVTESKCCKTTNSIDWKDEAGLTRITDHIAFRVNCLNIHVLGVTYYDHSLQTGPLEENQRIHEHIVCLHIAGVLPKRRNYSLLAMAGTYNCFVNEIGPTCGFENVGFIVAVMRSMEERYCRTIVDRLYSDPLKWNSSAFSIHHVTLAMTSIFLSSILFQDIS